MPSIAPTRVLWTCLGLSVAIGAMTLFAWQGKPQNTGNPVVIGASDKEKVNRWLRDNLDSPQWEEVAAIGPVVLKSVYEKQEKRLKETIWRITHEPSQGPSDVLLADEMKTAEEKLSALRSRGIRTIYGLRYRTKLPSGETKITQDLFEILPNSARRVFVCKTTDFPPEGQSDPDVLHWFGWRYLIDPDCDPFEDMRAPDPASVFENR